MTCSRATFCFVSLVIHDILLYGSLGSSCDKKIERNYSPFNCEISVSNHHQERNDETLVQTTRDESSGCCYYIKRISRICVNFSTALVVGFLEN